MTPDEREAIIEDARHSGNRDIHRLLEVIDSLSSDLKAIRMPAGNRNTREIVEKWAEDMHGRKPTWSEVNLCNRVAAALSSDTERKFTSKSDLVKALKDYLEAAEHGALDPEVAKVRFAQLLENA